MNYYEHHIGDYAEATAHLTFVEDAAYSRMIRKYYAQEKPLPADVKAVQRLVGARSKEEKDAVETVLAEFFKLEDDGWHNGRCDIEVERYMGKTEDKDAKRENERERQRRHRQRRKELFEALRGYGEVPPYATSNDELVALLERVSSRDVTETVTRDITANQSPVTSHQSPDKELSTSSTHQTANPVDPERPGETVAAMARHVQIALLLRAQGVLATAQNPIVAVTFAGDERITDDVLNLAIAKAKAAKPGETIPLKYLQRVVESELTALAAPATKFAEPAKGDPGHWTQSAKGIEAKGKSIGLVQGNLELIRDYAIRIQNELTLRKGQP